MEHYYYFVIYYSMIIIVLGIVLIRTLRKKKELEKQIREDEAEQKLKTVGRYVILPIIFQDRSSQNSDRKYLAFDKYSADSFLVDRECKEPVPITYHEMAQLLNENEYNFR